MIRCILRVTLATCLAVQTGCVSMSMTEEAEWGHLLHEDIVDEPIPHKNPWIAGSLDFIIPGVGHFYLGEWGSGGALFLSNILWPLSPFWATPAGVIDTKTVNKRYTVEYYTYGPGREVIEAKEREETFQAAKAYVRLMMQRGYRQLSQREITDFLFIQDFDRDYITTLDWHELQLRTGARWYTLRPPDPVEGQAGDVAPQSEDEDPSQASPTAQPDVGASPSVMPQSPHPVSAAPPED